MQKCANLHALYRQRFPLGSLYSLHSWTAGPSNASSFRPNSTRFLGGGIWCISAVCRAVVLAEAVHAPLEGLALPVNASL